MAVQAEFPYNAAMRRPLALIYVIITVVFFLGVIGTTGYRAQDMRSEARQTAAQSFRSYYTAVADQLREQNRIDASVAQRELEPRRQSNAGLRSIVLYSLRDGVYYLWAADRNRIAFSAAAAKVPIPDIETNRISEARFLESVQLDNRTVILEAVYRVLGPGDSFILLRDSLIAVLSFAVLTLFVAIISVLVSQRRSGVIKTTQEADIPLEPGVATAPPPDREAAPDWEVPPDWEAAPEAAQAPAEPPASEQPEPEPEPAASAPPPVEPPHPTVTASSLFSETSGVGHREHLEHRVSLELERAAYNEQDLAAALAAFPGIGADAAAYRQAAELLVERFGFRDLIFELDNESFCVILPNADLDEAINLVEDFQRTAAGRLPDSTGEPIFGLSARNGRLVDGERLIREAQSALERAAGASGRIIGFRPDPQKYRRHIVSKKPDSS